MFPNNLKQLDHLRDEKMIKFKEEIVDGVSVKIVSYMVASKELWEKENAIECRGHTYLTETGEIVSAALHKFFNVGENEHTLPENLPWDHYRYATEKVDGSMISSALINGKVRLKTKKSFFSDVAIEADKNCPMSVYKMCDYLLHTRLSPIFEYTSPMTQVVLDYGPKPRFTLLAIRNMDTGEYLDYDHLIGYSSAFGVDLTRRFELTYDEIVDQKDKLINFEGYVLRFGYMGMTTFVKLKMDDYLRKHMARTQLRERDVAEMVIDETLDDIKSVLTQSGLPLDPVEAIETRVVDQITKIRAEVEYMARKALELEDRKTVAMTLRDHPYFGMIMTQYSGKEPDYVKYFKRELLSSYSLATIYSNFVKGEIE